MENESVDVSGNTDNRLSSIMDMDYEAPKKEVEDEEVEPDSDKPAPSNEAPKKKPNEAKSEPKEDKEDEEEELEEEEEDDKEEKKESEKKKIKYKVDGEEVEEEVSDEDIAAALSAKKASLKKINEVNIERKKLQEENKQHKEDVEFVTKEMHGLRGEFEKNLEGFKKTGVVSGNPLSPIYNLLDKMGLDTAQFDKAALYYFLPMAEKFSGLSDEGKELFLSRHENEWHKRKMATLDKQRSEIAESRRKSEEEISALRQANISTEQSSELKDELTQMGVQGVDTKKIIEWAQIKPSYLRAQGIAEKVPGTNVNKITRILVEFPETTDEEILSGLGYKDIQKESVTRKLSENSKTPTAKLKTKSNDKVEEEVDDMFKKMFRR